MVRAHRRRRAASLERLRAAPMSRDPAPDRGRLVYRAPHQRMAEAEPARHAGRANQVAIDQLVERVQRVRLRHVGRGSRQVELERVARHRRALGQAAPGARQALELLDRRRGDGVGNLAPVDGRAISRVRPHPGQLEQVERIAATRVIEAREAGGLPVADERLGVDARQRVELDSLVGLAQAPLDRGHERALGLAAPVRRRHEHWRPRRTPEQVRDQLARGTVRPMQIVERQHHGLLLR